MATLLLQQVDNAYTCAVSTVDLSSRVGPALKELRQLRGLTAGDLRGPLGMDLSGIYRRESKSANLTVRTLGEHLEALGATLHDLADVVEGPGQQPGGFDVDPGTMFAARRILSGATEQEIRAYAAASAMAGEAEATIAELEKRYRTSVKARLEALGQEIDDGGE